jgi:hypothetical protein
MSSGRMVYFSVWHPASRTTVSSDRCIGISKVRFIQNNSTKTAVLNKLNAGAFIFMHYSVLLCLLFLRWGEAQLRKCLKREIVVLKFHPFVVSAVGQHGHKRSDSRSGRFNPGGYLFGDLLDSSLEFFFIRILRRNCLLRQVIEGKINGGI